MMAWPATGLLPYVSRINCGGDYLRREANTFSIIARCPRTGQLGVAVASAVPAVGSMCPFVRSAVGAASTQSWVNPYLALTALAELEGPVQLMHCRPRLPATKRVPSASLALWMATEQA